MLMQIGLTMKYILLLAIAWEVQLLWHQNEQYKTEGDNPYVIIQSKTFGALVASGNLDGRFGDFGKSAVKNGILDLGIAGGVATGGVLDAAIGLSDRGILSTMGAGIGKKITTVMGNI